MNKDELLKIYSAYMPYSLELQHKYQKAKHNGETVLRSWVKPLEPLDLGCLLPHRNDSFDWKPILWDLSYLTKEIEHEGKMITPIVEIMNGGDDIFEDMLIRLAAGLSNPDRLPYRIFIKLLSYHFNVFQLSEDQFINKATLTNK